MRMYLYADGAPFCLGTPTNHNTSHDVCIVNAGMQQLMADGGGYNTSALFLRRDDAIFRFVHAEGNYFICTDGILKYHGPSAKPRFSVVPPHERFFFIPLMHDKVETWFAEAATHIFPLVAHLGPPLKQHGEHRHDTLRPLVVHVPEYDADKSITGRPLVFPQSSRHTVPLITDKFLLADGTALQAISRNGRWYAESLVPNVNPNDAAPFFARHAAKPTTVAA